MFLFNILLPPLVADVLYGRPLTYLFGMFYSHSVQSSLILWNLLPFSLREPVSPLYTYLNPSFSSPLSPFVTPSLFHSKLKTYLFGKSFPP